MVAIKDNSQRFTPEEYFEWEEQQLERHEYIDGEVYAMTGGTINHGDVVELKSINLSMPIEQVYEDIEFE